ncbi:MAG: CapA family protein, partial [Flavobacteriaceae bacterium]|nr:CapA family protein [Flavobacteriaceae bacterium]
MPKLEEIEPEILPSKDTLSIVAVGDIMIGSAFPSEEFLPKDDGLNSFDAVKEYLKGDIVFGNLEGVFLDYGNSEKCKGKEPHRCYAFRMPERYAQIIKEAGFNVMSVANNHSMDFGEKGKKRTVEILEELNIHFAGYQEKPFEIFEKEGIKYAFCAFAPNLGMQSLLRISEAENIVRQLKNEVDIVIVSFHGGAEGTKHTRVPKKEEFFYGENRGDVYLFAHKMIDSGADIVLGHGPHITRAVEVYQGKFIAYSLGNFNTYGRFNLDKENGIAPLLDIQLDQNGNFIKAKVVSIKQIRNKGMFIDDEEKAFAELKRLSDLDFPNHSLIFENGEI